MKYKLISTVLIGVLAAGLYAEAATAPVRMGVTGNTAGTEVNDISEDEAMVGTDDMSAARAAAGMNDTAENGALSGTDEPADPEKPLPCMAGGIWAELRPEENIPVIPAVQAGFADENGPDADPADAEGIAPESEESGAEPENEYADFAIADVSSYVNVRSGPNTDSAIVGKIGSGAVAQVLETVPGENGDWFRVVSGNVEGYMKAEYFLYGETAAEAIDRYVTRYAYILASRLNVRQEPDVETNRIGYIDKGEKVKILENLGDWLKVQYTDSKTGYVSAEYVTVAEEFVYAKTLDEIAAEQAARKALEQRQNVSETQAAEDTAVTVTPPSGNYATNEELRAEIVAYAMQFLGNRYVHGGQSLETGTDCSGFTSLIYAQFGYSISRTPAGQLSNAGKSISYSEAQPGDIICYGSRRCTHVALYIGDGQIIHAANSRKGVVTQRADYDNILGVKNLIDP